MSTDNPSDKVAEAAARVQQQRALVVNLAKAKRFEMLPAAHQALRQMEDELKLARTESRLPN